MFILLSFANLERPRKINQISYQCRKWSIKISKYDWLRSVAIFMISNSLTNLEWLFLSESLPCWWLTDWIFWWLPWSHWEWSQWSQMSCTVSASCHDSICRQGSFSQSYFHSHHKHCHWYHIVSQVFHISHRAVWECALKF